MTVPWTDILRFPPGHRGAAIALLLLVPPVLVLGQALLPVATTATHRLELLPVWSVSLLPVIAWLAGNAAAEQPDRTVRTGTVVAGELALLALAWSILEATIIRAAV